MKTLTCVAAILIVTQSSQAADLEAGKRIASTVCAACHGATGISVSDTIPNLAGQRARYLEAQLKFFKDGTRKEPGAVSRPHERHCSPAQRLRHLQPCSLFRGPTRRGAWRKSPLCYQTLLQPKWSFPRTTSNRSPNITRSIFLRPTRCATSMRTLSL